MSDHIQTGDIVYVVKWNKAKIALLILVIAVLALAVVLYKRPEIKDNPLFIAVGFVATVSPCVYLLWDKYNSEKDEEEPPPGIPHQIPSPPRNFTGREDELAGLLASFERGATIIGLRGMGGIGKTALALVLAERLKRRFPGGQLFINMQGTSKNPLTPADAMAQVIHAYLGVDAPLPVDPNELGGLYRTVLSGKRILLLLDNAASREQVEPLLPPPGSAVIITSRNKFALPELEEKFEEKDLKVLPLEDAKKLLLEIAGRIGNHAEELARVCGRLPIALRNAAYTLKERKDFRVDEYLIRLKDAKKRLELVEASLQPELRAALAGAAEAVVHAIRLPRRLRPGRGGSRLEDEF